jgi:C-terminal processing protease CtpA/Prc
MSRTCFRIVILLLLSALPVFAKDNLSQSRDTMRSILKNVAAETSKNFYDPSLKGIDWKAATDNARQKIDNAKSVNEMEAAIYELLEQLDDSHTFFIPPMSSKETKYGFDAKPYGDEVRVYDVDPKGAAAQAGLQVGDRILQVAGYEAEREKFFSIMIYARLLYAVSPMRLLIQRPGKAPFEVDITPKIITRPVVIQSSLAYATIWALGMDDYEEWRKHSTFHYGNEGGVGWFEVRDFEVGGDFLAGVAEKTAGSKALIIDLRDSPGGAEDALLAFAGLFQDTDGEMGTATNRKKSRPLKVRAHRPYFGVPLFILVDSTTASASEMLARHLQKNRKAIVIGDKTMAAVTGAEYFPEEFGAGMIIGYGINIGTWKVALSDGEILEKKGIIPDVACIPTQEDMQKKHDSCFAIAMKMAKEAITPAIKAEVKQ